MNFEMEFEKYLLASIEKVNSQQDEASVREVLHYTYGLTYILDNNKELEYKIAIILEYLEGMQNFFPALHAVVKELTALRDVSIKQQLVAKAQQILIQRIDPDQVSPALVTFWLQRNCNMQEIKYMDTMMLFLSKEQQQKILQYDKGFLQDPYLQLLKRCLPT